MKFRVLSDSSCDITKEQEEQYHIGIIPYYVSMDGVHYKKDRVEITAEEFYREMAENPGVYPKTSTPTQVDLYNFFLPYAKAGEQVLYFNLTAKFSSSYQSITLIAEELMEEYPACKIIVVDSYSATVQEGLLVTEAARMAEDGLTLEEAAKRIETLKMTSRIFFTTADLSYLQKGGRVGKAMIQVASMLKIKPMIQLYEGELQAAGIVRSRKNPCSALLTIPSDFSRIRISTITASAQATAMTKRNLMPFMRKWLRKCGSLAFRARWSSITSAARLACIRGLHPSVLRSSKNMTHKDTPKTGF